MLFDTIQKKHKPYSFISLLRTRFISAFTALLIHGIVFVLLLYVVPLVQVRVFETEVVNVFIAPVDPLTLPDTEGTYEASDEIESNLPEEIIPPSIPGGSETVEGSLEGEDKRQENSVPSIQIESSSSSPLLSAFRLDKKTETLDESDSAKGPLLILAFPENRKSPPEKDDILPGKVVDFDKYLKSEFPLTGNLASKRRMSVGSSKVRGQQAQANITGVQFDAAPWASVVVERIQKNWIIPSDRENPAKGRVEIDVKISKKGELVEIQVVESSLIQSFDLAALNAIKDSAPFPSLPSVYPGVFIQIYFIFQYND